MADARYYADYLALDRLLDAQHPVSSLDDGPAHDEMLFIIVHQAFELWFKQILFELDAVLEVIGGEVVDDRDMGQVVARLGRIGTIQDLLIDQIDVLETMSPLDFLEFRDHLVPASGFQSLQFRLIENRLGLDTRKRLRIKGSRYTAVLSPEHVAILERSEAEPSLFDHVNRWLKRTPFLEFGDFQFWRAYQTAVETMIARDRQVIESHPNLDDQARNEQLALFEASVAELETLFDTDRYAEQLARGQRRLSYKAFLAALLINLYRDEPIFQLPYRFLTALVEVDEGFTAWRHRHALLAHRMIGSRIGTGGTSGHDYLEAAAKKHRIFRDLFDLPTFLIPRWELPDLPEHVRVQMGFRYRTGE